MDLRIIIVLAALFGLIYIFKVENKYAKIINGVCVVAIGISLIPVSAIAIDGFYIFFACHIGAIVYAVSYDEFTDLKKILISIIAIGSALPALFFIMAFDTEVWIGLLSCAPLVAFAYALKSDVKAYKNEIGFLVIMAANALTTFIGTIQYYALG